MFGKDKIIEEKNNDSVEVKEEIKETEKPTEIIEDKAKAQKDDTTYIDRDEYNSYATTLSSINEKIDSLEKMISKLSDDVYNKFINQDEEVVEKESFFDRLEV